MAVIETTPNNSIRPLCIVCLHWHTRTILKEKRKKQKKKRKEGKVARATRWRFGRKGRHVSPLGRRRLLLAAVPRRRRRRRQIVRKEMRINRGRAASPSPQSITNHLTLRNALTSFFYSYFYYFFWRRHFGAGEKFPANRNPFPSSRHTSTPLKTTLPSTMPSTGWTLLLSDWNSLCPPPLPTLRPVTLPDD